MVHRDRTHREHILFEEPRTCFVMGDRGGRGLSVGPVNDQEFGLITNNG